MTQAHNYQVGYQGHVYYGAPGGAANTEITEVLSLSHRDELGTSPLTPRGTGGIEMVEPTTFRIGLDLSIPYEPEGTNWGALATAYAGRLPIAIRVMDSTNTFGFEGDFIVTKFDKEEPNEGAVITRISLAPNYRYGRIPTYIS
jgi:hypothetical protein